eukprot:gene14417-20420_t
MTTLHQALNGGATGSDGPKQDKGTTGGQGTGAITGDDRQRLEPDGPQAVRKTGTLMAKTGDKRGTRPERSNHGDLRSTAIIGGTGTKVETGVKGFCRSFNQVLIGAAATECSKVATGQRALTIHRPYGTRP